MVVDFWTGSYSEKFSDKTVFDVPDNCSQACALGRFGKLF